jgi:hypothetical protein
VRAGQTRLPISYGILNGTAEPWDRVARGYRETGRISFLYKESVPNFRHTEGRGSKVIRPHTSHDLHEHSDGKSQN